MATSGLFNVDLELLVESWFMSDVVDSRPYKVVQLVRESFVTFQYK